MKYARALESQNTLLKKLNSLYKNPPTENTEVQKKIKESFKKRLKTSLYTTCSYITK